MNARITAIASLVLLSALAASALPSTPAECTPRGGLPNLMAKLDRGEPVRIAYLGGSITDAKGWRVMTTEWFEKTYPNCKFTALNAAHSGTGSDLACFRLERDLLPFKPDLVFIEFAVNDGIASVERIHRGVEGVIRKLRKENPLVDICLVYTLAEGWLKALQTGKTPHTYSATDDVAKHYNLPSIVLGLDVVRGVNDGTIVFKGKYPETDEEKAAMDGRILFSTDGVHPLKEGHAFYLDAIVRSMKKMAGVGQEGPVPFPARPYCIHNFDYVHPTPLERVKLSAGWRKLDPAKDELARKFQAKLPELWVAEAPGESITVRFKGISIMVYDLVGPDCGQVIVTVDGKETKVAPRFDAWTTSHRVYYLIAATGLEETEHVVRFEISAEEPDKAAILSKRGVTIDDPARFKGTKWYVGDILVTGEVLPAE